nr:putative ribonuclease H-like domain-containing protein [Tanacetum cinerariifolium]
MTGNVSYLSDYEPFNGGYVSFGQGGCKITGKGTVKTGKLEFENVYFVKDLKYNLFSVSQICDNKNSVLFTDLECIVLGRDFKLLDDTNILLRTPRQHNIYSIYLNNIVPHKDLTCLVAKASADECILWHRRLGHLNVKTMNKLVRHNLVRGLPTKSFDNDYTCTACLKGKQHKASCKSKLVNSVTKPLYTLHMDLFGPTFVSSISHKWYCLVVTDDFSRFTKTFFLRSKDETSGILKKFITETENLKDYKVKIIRCDNRGEFRNKEMNDFCSQKGIKREFSNARTPKQNGVAKRRNKTLIEAARTMKSSCFVRDLQGNDLLIGNHGSDLYTISLQDSTSSTPLCLMAKASPTQAWLWHQRLSHLNFYYINLLSKKDIVIGLPKLKYVKDQLCLSCELSKAKRSSLKSKALDYDNPDPIPQRKDVSSSADADVPSQQELNLLFGPLYDEFFNAEEGEQLQDDEFTNPFCAPTQEEAESSSHNIGNSNVPTFNQLIVSEYRWTKDHPLEQVHGNPSKPVQTRQQLAIDPEMCMFALNLSTAEPKNIKEAMADSAWMEAMQEELYQFDRLQKDKDQTVIRNKARLVAKGYAQEEDGFIDPDHPEKVYRLGKALYGLKQAPREWNDELFKFLISKGFTKGLQIHQSSRGVFINQAKYTLEILHKHGMDKGQSISTPMATKPKLDADLTGNPVDQTDYRSKIGSLMYLTSSRPDIVQAECSLVHPSGSGWIMERICRD